MPSFSDIIPAPLSSVAHPYATGHCGSKDLVAQAVWTAAALKHRAMPPHERADQVA